MAFEFLPCLVSLLLGAPILQLRTGRSYKVLHLSDTLHDGARQLDAPPQSAGAAERDPASATAHLSSTIAAEAPDVLVYTVDITEGTPPELSMRALYSVGSSETSSSEAGSSGANATLPRAPRGAVEAAWLQEQMQLLVARLGRLLAARPAGGERPNYIDSLFEATAGASRTTVRLWLFDASNEPVPTAKLPRLHCSPNLPARAFFHVPLLDYYNATWHERAPVVSEVAADELVEQFCGNAYNHHCAEWQSVELCFAGSVASGFSTTPTVETEVRVVEVTHGSPGSSDEVWAWKRSPSAEQPFDKARLWTR